MLAWSSSSTTKPDRLAQTDSTFCRIRLAMRAWSIDRRQGLRGNDTPPRQGRTVRNPPKALPGNPYDGHTLATVIPDMEALVGNTIKRIFADKGYRGHKAPPDYKFRVFISGQKRRMTPKIKREMRWRSAIEPSSVISRPSTAWAATTSGTATATPSTLSSPPPATTSACCSAGSGFCCSNS